MAAAWGLSWGAVVSVCPADVVPAMAVDGPGLEELRLAAEAADQREAWEDALAAYLRLEERVEEDAVRAGIRRRMDVLIALMREQGDRFDREAFGRLRPVLEAAADRGLHPAAMLLGERLRILGEAEPAFAVFLAAARRGFPPAQIQVGLMYSNGDGVEQSLGEASRWLRPANVKGDPVGKYLLAECFLFGKGVPQNQEQAVALLEEAVEMDNPGRAMDLLATCFHKGWGVEKDFGRAVELYRDACAHGFYNACANLAVMTMRGDGVPADPADAVSLLKDGVDAGNPRCMFFYAAAHWDGMGVARNPDIARQWFRRAAELGHAEAIAWCRQNQVPIGAGEE
jgi:hypothetical protein